MNNIVEALAAVAHEMWSGWMKYMFGKCKILEDGWLGIPPDLVARWKRQMSTLYENLPEEEKESDRVEARSMLLALRKVRHDSVTYSSDDLMPCPICGAFNVFLVENDRGHFMVQCETCKSVMLATKNPVTLIHFWNSRDGLES